MDSHLLEILIRARDQATDVIKNVHKEAQGFWDRAREGAKLAGGAITAFGAAGATGLISLGKAAIEQASKFQGFTATLETVFQGNKQKAQEYINWAVDFAKTTPFEVAEVVDATSRLKSYGIEAKDVLRGVGDMAAGMGKPLMQAVEAVADAQTGELERLKEFGITKQMIVDQAKAMGMKEVVNAKGQITDMDNFNRSLFALMQTRFSGGMERLSQTYEGQLSNLSDAWNGFLRNIGALILPLAQELVSNVLIPLIEKLKQMDPDKLKTGLLFAAIATGAALIIGPLLMLVGFLPALAAGFGMIAPAILPALAIVAVLAAAAYLVYKNWGTLKALFISLLPAFRSFGQQLKPAIDFFKHLFLDAYNFIKQQFNYITSWIRQNMGLIKGTIEQVLRAISYVWNAVWPILKPVVETVWNAIKIIVSTVIHTVLGIIKAVMQVINGDWRGAWNTVKATFAGLVNGIISLVRTLASGLLNILSGAWSSVKKVVGDGVGIVKNLFSGLVSSARNILSGIVDAITAPFRNAYNEAKKWIGNIKSAMNSINPFARHSPSLIDNVIAGVDVIKKKYAELGGSATSFMPSMAMQPAVASGGPAITNNFYLAGLTIRSDEDIEKLSQNLYNLQRGDLRSKGVES